MMSDADLYAALLAHCPQPDALRRWAALRLGVNLAALAGPSGQEQAFALIEWATSTGQRVALEAALMQPDPAPPPAPAPGGGVTFYGPATIHGPAIGGDVDTLIMPPRKEQP